MKEILEKIHKILLTTCTKSPIYTKPLGDAGQELGKLIDALPDEGKFEGKYEGKFEDKLSESEKGFLRGDESEPKAKIIKAGSKGTLSIK